MRLVAPEPAPAITYKARSGGRVQRIRSRSLGVHNLYHPRLVNGSSAVGNRTVQMPILASSVEHPISITKDQQSTSTHISCPRRVSSAHEEHRLHVRHTPLLLHEVLHNIACVALYRRFQHLQADRQSVTELPPLRASRRYVRCSSTALLSRCVFPVLSSAFLRAAGYNHGLFLIRIRSIALDEHPYKWKALPTDRYCHRQTALALRGRSVREEKTDQRDERRVHRSCKRISIVRVGRYRRYARMSR